MTTTEIEELLLTLQEQVNQNTGAIATLDSIVSGYVTTDDLTAITNKINTVEAKLNTVQTTLAALKESVNKINNLQSLLDVKIVNLTEDDLLQYGNDGKWHNVQPNTLGIVGEGSTGTVTSLSELQDVSITGATNGQVLLYNSVENKWTNATFEVEDVNLTEYLTKSVAENTYFKKSGGEINGSVSIVGALDVSDDITSLSDIYANGAITAKKANE